MSKENDETFKKHQQSIEVKKNIETNWKMKMKL
jgi:hypothetical protein